MIERRWSSNPVTPCSALRSLRHVRDYGVYELGLCASEVGERFPRKSERSMPVDLGDFSGRAIPEGGPGRLASAV